MRKSIKIFVGGLALGTLAGVGGYQLASRPAINNCTKLGLLRATSQYLQKYNGPNVKQALAYANLTLNIVSESENESENPKIPTSQLEGLKTEVTTIEKEIESSQTQYVPDEILTQFNPSANQTVKDELLQEYSLTIKEEIPGINVTVLEMNPDVLKTNPYKLDEAIEALSNRTDVANYAEKNYIGRVADYLPELRSLGYDMEELVDRLTSN